MKFIPFIFITALLCSCVSTRQAHLNYTPITKQLPLKPVAVSVEKVEDMRKDKSYLGRLENLYGMTIVKITSSEELSCWLKKALKTELSRAGYQVNSASNNGSFILDCRILDAYAYLYLWNYGYVQTQITVIKNGKTLLRKIYQAKCKGPLTWSIRYSTQSQDCLDALQLSLQQINSQLITDLDKITKRNGL